MEGCGDVKGGEKEVGEPREMEIQQEKSRAFTTTKKKSCVGEKNVGREKEKVKN